MVRGGVPPSNSHFLERELEYIFALTPLAATMCAIPTMAETDAGQAIWDRPLIMHPLEFARHCQDLVLTEAALRSGRWWTLVSYMFVHQDLDHLFGNLRTLAVSGLAVHQDVGTSGMYLVLLVSGLAAGLNRPGRAFQAEAQLKSSIPRVPASVMSLPVPECARELWDSVREKAAQVTAPVINERVKAFGASGATAGLMGYGLGLVVERLWRGLVARQQQQSVDPVEVEDAFVRTRDGGLASRWPDDENRRYRCHGFGSSDIALLTGLLNVAQCGAFLMREWRCARGDESWTGVDHVGHLTGFAAGVALLLVARVKGWQFQLE